MSTKRMALSAVAVVCGAAVVLFALSSSPLVAYETREGRVKLTTHTPFSTVAAALKQAIAEHKMGLVCHANAQAGAASLGQKIPGNQVLMIYRPDFAIRMLAADVEAGFEAPIGTATHSYVKPSLVFKPYKNAALDQMATALDGIVEAIVKKAMAIH